MLSIQSPYDLIYQVLSRETLYNETVRMIWRLDIKNRGLYLRQAQIGDAITGIREDTINPVPVEMDVDIANEGYESDESFPDMEKLREDAAANRTKRTPTPHDVLKAGE